MRPDSVPDLGAIQIIYLLTYLNEPESSPELQKLQKKLTLQQLYQRVSIAGKFLFVRSDTFAVIGYRYGLATKRTAKYTNRRKRECEFHVTQKTMRALVYGTLYLLLRT